VAPLFYKEAYHSLFKASHTCSKATSCIVSQVGEYIYFKTNQNKVLSNSEFDTENGRSHFSQFCANDNPESTNVHWVTMQNYKGQMENF
jgi:hypothetical protein